MSILGQSAGLLFKIDGDSSALQKELKGVDAAFSSIGSKLGTLGGVATVGAAAFAALGTAAVAGTAALFNLTRQAAEYGSAIFDAKEKTGLSAATLSTLKLSADNAGSSLEQVTSSTAKFAKTLGEARDGNEKAQQKLKELNVTTYDLDEALSQATQTIFNAKEGTDQIVLAQKAFGKSGADLLPVIKQLGGDLAGATKEAERLGLTLSEKDIAASDAFGDSLGLLSAQAKTAAVAFTSDLMPILTSFFTSASEWYAKNQDQVRAWGTTMADTISGTIILFKDMEVQSRIAFASLGMDFEQNASAAESWSIRALGAVNRVILAIATAGISEFFRSADAAGAKARMDEESKWANVVNMTGDPGTFVSANRGGGVRGVGGGGGGGGRPKSGGGAAKADTSVQDAQGRDRQALELFKEGIKQQIIANDIKLAKMEISEREHLEEIFRLKVKELEHEKQLLTDQLNLAQLTAKQREDIEHRLDVIRTAGYTNALENEKELTDQTIKDLDESAAALRKLDELKEDLHQRELQRDKELNERRKKQANQNLEDRLERKRELEDRTQGATLGGGGFAGGLAGSISIMGDAALKARDKAAAAANGIKASWMSMGSAVMGGVDQMVAGLGSMVEAWVLYGSAGPNAMRKMVASVLAGVAAQSAVLAIFELAKGFAALFWNPAEAGAHFTAAALFGGLAVGTAIAGRAIAGDSFNQQTDRATGGSSSSASNNRSGNGQVFSSNPDAVNEGGINQTPSRGIASNITLTIKTTKDHIVEVVKSNIAGNGSLRTAIQDAAV